MGFLRSEEQELADRSEELVKILREHEAGRPAMEKAFAEADKRCMEVARELVVAREAGSATCQALAEELAQLRIKRDSIRMNFDREARATQIELEELTSVPIREYIRWALDEVRRLPKQQRTIEREVTGFGERSGEPVVTLTTNIDVIHERQEVLLSGIQKIRNLQHDSLATIRAFVEDLKKRLDSIDLGRKVAVEMPNSLASDITSRPEEPKFTQAWLQGDGGVIAQGGLTDDKTAGKRLNDRIHAMKSKLGRA